MLLQQNSVKSYKFYECCIVQLHLLYKFDVFAEWYGEGAVVQLSRVSAVCLLSQDWRGGCISGLS